MIPSRRAAAAAADGPRKAARAAAAVAVLVAAPGFLLLAGGPAAAAPTVTTAPVRAVAAQAAQLTQEDVKYYIVPPAVNGKMEFLFEIAQKTLGDGNRFPEIVELNRGRLQPDGSRLDNPDSILPGWILQLPDDAAGPGVQEGPLPTVQQVPRNDDGTEIGIGPAGDDPQNAPVTPLAGGQAGSGGNSTLLLIGGSVLAVLLAGAGIVLALLGREPRASRPARAARPPKLPKQPKQPRRRKEPRQPTEEATEPAPQPESQSQAQPRPQARLAARRLLPSGRFAPTGAPKGAGPATAKAGAVAETTLAPEAVAAPETALVPETADVAETLGAAEPSGFGDILGSPPAPPAPAAPPSIPAAPPAPPVAPPAPPVAPPVAEEIPPAPPRIELPPPPTMLQTSVPSMGAPAGSERARVVDDREALVSDHDQPPVIDELEPGTIDELEALISEPEAQSAPPVDDQPAPPPAPDLSLAIVEQVSFGDDVIHVQIATASPGAAPVEWTPMPYDVPQDGVAYVCLGASDKGCLFVDLGRAPGPVSIGGDSEAAARLVESIAFQLSAALEPDRASVTVVGDIGKSMELGQVTRAGTLGQVVSRGSAAPEGAEPPLELLICSRESARDDTALAWLTSDRNRRIVPIVIGGLPTAPWSLTTGNAERQSSPVARSHGTVGV